MFTPPPAALLFDLDGTLVDTDAAHIRAWNDVLAELGRSMEPDFYRAHVMGAANDSIKQALFPEMAAEEWPRWVEAKEAAFRAGLGALHPAEGLVRLLDWADRLSIPTGVVTNAPRPNAELMLQGLGLADRFDALVIGQELAHGKPHPLPYLTGLEKLGSAADSALAFEDSPSGIRAAAAAGIHTVGMLATLREEALKTAGAATVIRDFADPALWTLLGHPATH